MPVTVEVLTNSNEQDYQDIASSYQQRVANAESSTLGLPSTYKQFCSEIDQPANRLYGARFNGRLIGWALVSQITETKWKLEVLCVGLPNQGRGVGQRLLNVIAEQATAEACQLIETKPIAYFD